MAEVTIQLRDAPEGVVTVHSTFTPAIGARVTPAQSLAMDLQNQAVRRAEVIALDPHNQAEGMPEGVEAVSVLSPKSGDLLVLRCRQRLSSVQLDYLSRYVKSQIPAGVSFLVLDSAFSVEQTQPGVAA